MKSFTRSGAAVLLCLTLSGCGPSNPEEKYREAIATVDGVQDVKVDWNENGAGSSTRITISAASNEQTELSRILDESLRAFAESTEPGEYTTLSYQVLSEDQSVALTPDDLGVTVRGLDEIREHYGLE